MRLHERVRPTADLADLADADAALLVVPAQTVRAATQAVAAALPARAPLVVCAKGIERGTGLFLERRGARDPAGLAGRGALRAELCRRRGARAADRRDACLRRRGARRRARRRRSPGRRFRLYRGTDVRGVEIGGAAKNVLAIACGAVAGRGLGESAKAALIARGFAELMRFARACGGRPETLMGLSGLGDLVLTCGSAHSRNFAFGERLGRGVPVAEAAAGKLAEGAVDGRRPRRRSPAPRASTCRSPKRSKR